jgi:hypothetical protein
MFSGLKLDAEKSQKYWGRRFLEILRQMPCETQPLRYALDTAVEEYLHVRKLLGQTTKQVRTLSQREPIVATHKLLRSIPGIGIVKAMIINLRRFLRPVLQLLFYNTNKLLPASRQCK